MSSKFKYSKTVMDAQVVRSYWFEYNGKPYNMRQMCDKLDRPLKDMRRQLRHPRRTRMTWDEAFSKPNGNIRQIIGPKAKLLELHNSVERAKAERKHIPTPEDRDEIMVLAVSLPWK